jgi:hypothetical protein
MIEYSHFNFTKITFGYFSFRIQDFKGYSIMFFQMDFLFF